MAKTETYLGDGVYAAWEDNQLYIYTSDGIHSSDHIYLEPEVIKKLIEFYSDMTEKRKGK